MRPALTYHTENLWAFVFELRSATGDGVVQADKIMAIGSESRAFEFFRH